MNMRKVIKDLQWERRRLLAMSRVADPLFAKDYLDKAHSFGAAAAYIEQNINKHRRKDTK